MEETGILNNRKVNPQRGIPILWVAMLLLIYLHVKWNNSVAKTYLLGEKVEATILEIDIDFFICSFKNELGNEYIVENAICRKNNIEEKENVQLFFLEEEEPLYINNCNIRYVLGAFLPIILLLLIPIFITLHYIFILRHRLVDE